MGESEIAQSSRGQTRLGQTRFHGLPARVLTTIGHHPLDALGLLMATLYGLASVLYPYGRDQALFAYVGDGWLDGHWPYVTAVENKPPGIFAIYALADLFFGRTQVAIRIADLIGVLVMGWFVAHVLRRGREMRDGELGAAALLAAGLYYTCFVYWDTAHPELWEGLFLVAAWALVSRERVGLWRVVVAGALTGFAFLIKYPAVVVAVGIGSFAAWSMASDGPATSWRRRGLRFVWGIACFGFGAVLAIVLGILPLAFHGALFAFWDTSVLFNLFYSSLGGSAASPFVFWEVMAPPYTVYLLMSLFLVLRALSSSTSSERSTLSLEVLVLLLLSYGAVALQRKFWGYHHGVMVPFITIAILFASLRVFSRRPRAVFAFVLVAVAVGFLLAPPWAFNERRRVPMTYRVHVGRLLAWATGAITRDQYLQVFIHDYGYNYLELATMAREIRSQAHQGDSLCVFGFEPPIYLLSRLRCPSRFFATHLIYGELEAYREGAWRKEYEKKILRNPPTFLVLGPERYTGWVREQYTPIRTVGRWLIVRQRDRGRVSGG